jgi:exosortase/archaeosortase family protein
MSALSQGGMLCALAVLSFWPVWRWLLARCTDGTAESFGLVSWALAALLVAARVRSTAKGREPAWWVASALVLGYALVYAHLPPIVRAFWALSTLTVLLSSHLGSRFSLPLWGLLLLGLPIEASLSFFVGYPLRLVATHVSAQLLHGLGFAVLPQGTQLVWGALEVGVDAPCSGIGMLRMALVSCCALALSRNVRSTLWAGMLAATCVLAVLANALRSASLFLLEGGFLGSFHGLTSSLHAGAGLVLFALVLALQWWLLGWQPSTLAPAKLEAA